MPPEDWSENVYLVHMADDPAFSEEMESVLRESRSDPRHVVLDMASVSFMNSSNLSQLLRLRETLRGTSSRIILAAVQPEVWSTFLVSGLDKVFSVAQNVPLALAELQLDEAAASE